MTNQHTVSDPTTRCAQPPFPARDQAAPGLGRDMDPKPDHGEHTYEGSGRLTAAWRS